MIDNKTPHLSLPLPHVSNLLTDPKTIRSENGEVFVIVDEKTKNLSLPLPHANNYLEDDISRLRASFVVVDTAVGAVGAAIVQLDAQLDSTFAQLDTALDTKADAETVNAALDTKADAATVNAALDTKADASTVGSITPESIGAATASHTHEAADLGIPSQFFRGFITTFYGSLGGAGNKFPLINGVAQTSWHVCDGADGTPDMRDRVAVGVSVSKGMGSAGGGESKTVGGSVSVNSASVSVSGTVGATTLTVEQMPSHGHSCGDAVTSTNSGTAGGTGSTGSRVVVTSSSRNNITANPTGGSQSHTHPLTASGSSHNHSANFYGNALNVVQPYLALHYIMYMG